MPVLLILSIVIFTCLHLISVKSEGAQTCNSHSGGDTGKATEAILSHMTDEGFIDEDRANDGLYNRNRFNPYGNAVNIVALDSRNARKTLIAWKQIYDYQKRGGGFHGFYFFYGDGAEPLIDSEKDRRLTAQAAWMSLAISHYVSRKEISEPDRTEFSKMRDDINDWILKRNRNPDGGLSMGEGQYDGDLGYGQRTKAPIQYANLYATEHNIDAYAALKSSSRASDRREAGRLEQYLLGRFDLKTNMFDGGYKTADERPLDAQTWLVLALDETKRKQHRDKLNAALKEALRRYQITAEYKGRSVTGLHSGNGDIRGVWPEGTYGMIQALQAMAKGNEMAGDSAAAKQFREKARFYSQEMAKLQNESGAFIYDTSGAWNSGVPFDHMSGTAWSILSAQGVNPFNPSERLGSDATKCPPALNRPIG
ncbi:MAG: hypothetical protein HYV04_20020 [Deltaproteobacteria bacterium]|nr:hypothetical protein [Deltaproteobacteria bacterium]